MPVNKFIPAIGEKVLVIPGANGIKTAFSATIYSGPHGGGFFTEYYMIYVEHSNWFGGKRRSYGRAQPSDIYPLPEKCTQ